MSESDEKFKLFNDVLPVHRNVSASKEGSGHKVLTVQALISSYQQYVWLSKITEPEYRQLITV